MRLLALLAMLLWPGLAAAQPATSLQFFDAPVFDSQLSDSLASKGQVQVRFPPGVPIAMNGCPLRSTRLGVRV